MNSSGSSAIMKQLFEFIKPLLKQLGSSLIAKYLDPPGDISGARSDDLVQVYNLLVNGLDANIEASLYASVISNFFPNYFQKNVYVTLPIFANSASTSYSWSSGSATITRNLCQDLIATPFWTSTIFPAAGNFNFELVRICGLTVEYMPDNFYDTSATTVLPYFTVNFLPSYNLSQLPSALTALNMLECGDVLKISPGMPYPKTTFGIPLQFSMNNSANFTFPSVWTNTNSLTGQAANYGGVLYLGTPNASVSSGGTNYSIGSLLVCIQLEVARSLK